jgi:uncharacterized membrane protein
MRSPHHVIWRQLRARPRLMVSLAAGALVVFLLPQGLALLPQGLGWPPQGLVLQQSTRLIIGWNVTTCLYLLLVGLMMRQSDHAQLQRRSYAEDEGKLVILTLVIVASAAALSAVVIELMAIKNMAGGPKYARIALAALTIVSSWAFNHMMFALHYAHDYYVANAKNLPGGLDFPGNEAPDYVDFLYFSFVIGTSGQTADVAFTSKSMRHVGLVHCVVAFFFNTTVLALTINIAAGLI